MIRERTLRLDEPHPRLSDQGPVVAREPLKGEPQHLMRGPRKLWPLLAPPAQYLWECYYS